MLYRPPRPEPPPRRRLADIDIIALAAFTMLIICLVGGGLVRIIHLMGFGP